jgi:hypothetical protein
MVETWPDNQVQRGASTRVGVGEKTGISRERQFATVVTCFAPQLYRL